MAFRRLLPDGSRTENYYYDVKVHGKSIQRSTGTTNKAKAERIEKAVRKGLRSAHPERVLAAINGVMLRRVLASIGEIEAAYLDPGMQIMKSKKQGQRNASDLLLVVAYAKDLWLAADEKRRPDKVRIRKESAAILDGAFVKRYYAARYGGSLNWTEPREGNRSINSTLDHARDVFRGKGKMKLEGLALPDLTSFLKHPALPEEAKEPEPIYPAEFALMMQAWEGDTNEDRRLVNLLLRQTGLRSGSSAAHVHVGWLNETSQGVWLDVREVKGGTAQYSVPITPELAGALRSAALRLGNGGYVLPGEERARVELVSAHNAWLKGVIGAPVRGQGNHRFRDTMGTVLLSTYGIDAAREALGHANVQVTRRHYARVHMDVSELMRYELRAFERLSALAR